MQGLGSLHLVCIHCWVNPVPSFFPPSAGPSLPITCPGSHCPWTLLLSSGLAFLLGIYFTSTYVLQAVWMVTWVAAVTLSVDLGLAIGVIFSMMTVVCRTQRWE